MVTDKVENFKKYINLHPAFKDVRDFLLYNDLNKMPNGKYLICGNKIFVNINDYETENDCDRKFEAHRKYIDVQVVLKGEELIGIEDVEYTEPISEYDEEKDLIFLKAQNNCFRLCENRFAIFDTDCAHKPQISTQENKPVKVKKAIFKILK